MTLKTWFQQHPLVRRSLYAVLGLGLAAGALTACGHGPRHAGSMTEAEATQWRERMVDRVAGKLDLDATQKQHLTALADTLNRQRQALQAGRDGQAPRAEWQALIAGPRLDVAAAQALVQRKTEWVRNASPEVLAAAATFYDSLQPAQQAQVREFMNRAGTRRGHGPFAS